MTRMVESVTNYTHTLCPFGQRSGLGALIMTALEVRLRYPDKPLKVDWSGRHLYYDWTDGANAFEHLFLPQPEMLGEADWSALQAPVWNYVSPTIGWTMLHPHWTPARRRLNDAWNEVFQVRPDILAQVPPVSRLMGAIYRTEKNIEIDQISKAIPPIEAFADVVEEEANGRDIWMCAHAAESMSYFRDRWGKRLHHSKMDRTSMEGSPHRGGDAAQLRSALVEILTLSRCAGLVHSTSNMATVALVINPRLSHRFIQWKWPLQF